MGRPNGDLTVAATSSSVAGVTLPCSSATAIAPFSSAGLDGIGQRTPQ